MGGRNRHIKDISAERQRRRQRTQERARASAGRGEGMRDDLISRKTAIEEMLKCGEYYNGNDEAKRGVAQCIGVIHELPSAQPEIEERKGKSAQNVSKEDLISRKAAIEAILSRTNCKSVRDLYEYNAEHDLHMMWTGGIVDAIDMVIGVPSAEPEIIRCKDCRYTDEYGVCQSSKGLAIQDDDDFCSHAERREG